MAAIEIFRWRVGGGLRLGYKCTPHFKVSGAIMKLRGWWALWKPPPATAYPQKEDISKPRLVRPALTISNLATANLFTLGGKRSAYWCGNNEE